jgi:hypothetical protein
MLFGDAKQNVDAILGGLRDSSAATMCVVARMGADSSGGECRGMRVVRRRRWCRDERRRDLRRCRERHHGSRQRDDRNHADPDAGGLDRHLRFGSGPDRFEPTAARARGDGGGEDPREQAGPREPSEST